MAFASYIDQYGGFDADDIQASAEFKKQAKDDTVDAKLEPGEIVLHPEVYKDDPELIQHIFSAMIAKGQNPFATIAGSEMGQYDPMDPNSPQHFFFGKIFRTIKKVVKKIAKNPVTRFIATAAATAVNPALGAAVSGGLTKAAGGSWGQALGSAAGSYFGGKVMGGTTSGSGLTNVGGAPVPVGDAIGKFDFGTIANSSTGLSTGLANTVGNQFGSFTGGVTNLLGDTIGGAIGNINLGSAMGSMMGESLGTMAGGMIDPPKIQLPMGVNYPTPANYLTQVPRSTLNLGLGASANPMYAGSNIGPVGIANPLNTYGRGTGANISGSDLGTFGMSIPGVSMISQAKDRLGRDISRNVGAFGNAVLKADRGWSLGKGGQGGVGVLYY